MNLYHLYYYILTAGGDFKLWQTATVETEITWLKCNRFFSDDKLDGWEWYVRVLDYLGNFSPITEIRTYRFTPCRLDDGTPCHLPP